jgi:hypothetical protein
MLAVFFVSNVFHVLEIQAAMIIILLFEPVLVQFKFAVYQILESLIIY